MLARLIAEIRFLPSLMYAAKGLQMVAGLSPSFARFEVNNIAAQLYLKSNSSIGFDPQRIVVTVTGADSNLSRLRELAKQGVTAWTTDVAPLPKVTRIGLRVQIADPSEMTQPELAEVCREALFSAKLLTQLAPTTDFAITLEERERWDSLAGTRLVLGVMSYEELIQKWALDNVEVEDAGSFLTWDFDYGASSLPNVRAGASPVDDFIIETWNLINSRYKAIQKTMEL